MIGQINLDSEAGKMINKISEQEDVSSIVEIGAWNGLGSTRCVLAGLTKKSECNFISLESNLDMFNVAKKHNEENNVNLIYGRIVDVEDLDIKDLHGPEQKWFNNDFADYKLTPNVIDQIPNEIDFLILDGGEFSTKAEFNLLKDRSRYIFLDDTQTRKNKEVREELLSDSGFECVVDAPADRNGWALFKINGHNTDQ